LEALLPHDESYAKKKLDRLLPVFREAAIAGFRESTDAYPATAHIHRTMTRRNIARDHIVDHLRARLLTDPDVSFKDRNQTTYLDLFGGEFRVLAKMADNAGSVSLNANQSSFAYQENSQTDMFSDDDTPGTTNLYLSYVPNSREPRDPFIWLICPKAGGWHWRFEIEPPAVEVAGEVTGKPSPAPDHDADDLIRIPAQPKPEESE
jgi:hypothetical protein